MKVFVSSTYTDLVEHRRAVVDALQRRNLTPVAMETFAAEPREPTDACFDRIDSCDAFVGIYASRYGYRPDGGPSITELEYHHARRRAPKTLIFCFLARPDGQAASQNDPDGQRLEDFKQQVREQVTCDHFTSPAELAERVVTALSNELERRYMAATGDLNRLDWDHLPPKALSTLFAFVNSAETEHQRSLLRGVAAVLINRYPQPDGASTSMAPAHPPIVARREHFGSLMFIRKDADYIPFDREATEILLRARERSLEELSRSLPSDKQRHSLQTFALLARKTGILDACGRFPGGVLSTDRSAEGRLSAPVQAVLWCTHASTRVGRLHASTAQPPMPGELTTVEVKGLLDQLAEGGCFRLRLDGEEPLLRADLPAVLEHATARGLSITLGTGALAATAEITAELRRFPIERITIRLDAATPELHEAICGLPGAFDAVVEGVRRLRWSVAPIDAYWRVTKANVRDLEAMLDLVATLQLQRLLVQALPPGDQPEDAAHETFSDPEILELYDRAVAAGEARGVLVLTPRSPRRRLFGQRCACGTLLCHVDPRGVVSPTGDARGAADDDSIRRRGINEIWASSEALGRARDRQSAPYCRSCFYFDP